MKRADLYRGIIFVGTLVSVASIAFLSVGCGPGGQAESETGSSSGSTSAIVLAAGVETLPADGASSTSVTATLTASGGGAVPKGTSVTFTTDLGSFPGGVRTYTASTPDDAGTVTISLITGQVSGTATVTANASNVTQSVAVSFTASAAAVTTPGSAASIEVYQTQADTITVTGSGEPETTKITFAVKDSAGVAVADDTAISFSIVGGGVGGGESLSNSSGTTTSGYAYTILQSGTKAGPVQIRAALTANTSIKTSKSITIAGGPPFGEHLGINPETLNIAGLKISGLEDKLTTRVTDKYFNNVPDGTTMWFTSDFAGVTGSAVTESNGGAQVSFATDTLTSQDPNPITGFVTAAVSTQSGGYSRVLCIAVHPTKTWMVYVGTDGGGVFKTTDRGTNWSQVGRPETGLTNGIVWDLKLDPENPAILYAATSGGLFQSKGNGDSWQRISGGSPTKNVSPSSVAPSQTILDTTDADNDGLSDTTYILDTPSNTIRSTTHVFLDGVEKDNYVYISPTSIKFIVMGLDDFNNADITLNYVSAVMIPETSPVRALALTSNTDTGNPALQRVLYAGTLGSGVYRSINGGRNWTAVNRGLADTDVLSLAIATPADGGNDDVVYAGTQGGGVFKTTNSGATWATLNSELAASIINKIRIDPNDSSRLYVATPQDGVYYSTNYGGTWTEPDANVGSSYVTDIVMDTTASPATEIYATTHGNGTDPLGGVYKSSDGGANWTRLTALTENNAEAIGIVGGSPDTLYVGTTGRNIFKSTNSGLIWSAVNGSAPNEITNQIFATTQVLFSDDTGPIKYIQAVNTYQGAGGDDYYNGLNARNDIIYNKESASFIYTVADLNGNPLLAGSTIVVTASKGTLMGDTSVTIPDTQWAEDYSVIWRNDITTEENSIATLTFTVTSANGNKVSTLSRELIKPLAIKLSPELPLPGVVFDVRPSGGSETLAPDDGGTGGYLVTCQDDSEHFVSYGDKTSCTSGSAEETAHDEIVVVQDLVTGQIVEASYTLPAAP